MASDSQSLAPDVAAEEAPVTEGSASSVSSQQDMSRSETDSGSRSFVDAAWDKYNGDMSTDDCIGIYVPKKGPAKITDSGHLILPWRVHMTNCGITEAGQHADMSSMCHHVTELDLSHNNLTCLEEVLRVIRCMPQLTFLNLTNNPLRSVSVSIATSDPSPTSPSLTNVMVTSDITTVSEVSDASGGTYDVSPSTPSSQTDADTSSGTSRAGDGSDSNANTETTTTTTSTTGSFGADMAVENSMMYSAAVTAAQYEGSVSPVSAFSAFSTVRQLVLNDTGIDWPGIVELLKLFPSLEELHLSLNKYISVDLPQDFIYPSLTRLFFNNNSIDTWTHITSLGHAFPSLQHLFLSDTHITALDMDGDRMAQLFPSLSLLSLNKTQLSGWEEVEQLRLFPSLTDVRLLGIPFLEAMEEKARREQLVARLPNITRLNGSGIMEEERLDAERAFIRLFLDSEHKPNRYYELEKVYGKLEPLVKVSLAPQTVFTVDVVIDDRQEKLEVNVNQTVRDLKKSLQNIVGLPASKFNVFYHDKEAPYVYDKLVYLDKMLYTYHLNDGDQFIIEPKK